MRSLYVEYYISPLSRAILTHASQYKSMAIWGFYSAIYVETGIIPATRYPNSGFQMFPNPNKQYYVRQYADDLLKSKTDLFIYTTAGFLPNMERLFGKPHQSPEDFPEIASILKKYYKLVVDQPGVKIYIKQPSGG